MENFSFFSEFGADPSLMSPVGLPCLLLISILGFQSGPVLCYSNGKVSKACGSMVPQHSGSGETSPSPYQLQTNSTTFSPKDQVRGNLNRSPTELVQMCFLIVNKKPFCGIFLNPPQSSCLDRLLSRVSCFRPEMPSIQAQRPPLGRSR